MKEKLKLPPEKWAEFEEWKKGLDDDDKMQIVAIIKCFEEVSQETKKDDEEKFSEMLRIYIAHYLSLPLEHIYCSLFLAFADGWDKGMETALKIWMTPGKGDMSLSEVRKARGFTQQDLAKLMGVSPYVISLWEDKKVTPSIEDLMRLSDVLQVEMKGLCEFFVKNKIGEQK